MQREIGGAGWPDGGPVWRVARALSSSFHAPSASGGCIYSSSRVVRWVINGCVKGEPKGKKRRAPKQPPPGQTLPTDMDHRLRWRDCSWRMGGQDVMRLCSTSGRYVTSLEIRHFHGNLGDESGRAMMSSAWEVGSQLSSRPNGWQPQYLNPSSLLTEDHR